MDIQDELNLEATSFIDVPDDVIPIEIDHPNSRILNSQWLNELVGGRTVRIERSQFDDITQNSQLFARHRRLSKERPEQHEPATSGNLLRRGVNIPSIPDNTNQRQR